MLSLVNTSEEEVLEFFCMNPTKKYSVSEVSEELSYSKPSISSKFDDLNDKGVLDLVEERNSKLASFNRGENTDLKQLVNLDRLHTSDLIKEIVEDYKYPETIILFGSYSKGEDTEQSDIDIAVITSENLDKEYGKIMGREISVTEFKPDEIPENMLETLANGIILHGYLNIIGEDEI